VQQYILLITRDSIQLFVTGIRYDEVVINDMQSLCWWKAINSCNSRSYHDLLILVQTKWIFLQITVVLHLPVGQVSYYVTEVYHVIYGFYMPQ